MFSIADPDNPGKSIRRYPTAEERLRAAEVLTRKIMPDMKATEISGPDGGPVQAEDLTPTEDLTATEAARHILFALRIAEEEAGKTGQHASSCPLMPEAPAPVSSSIDTEASEADESSAPAPMAPPAELPAHSYIFIEQGERERSGERAWLAMEGRGKILRTFHGADARRLARDWIGTKFGASPAGEIEVLLFEGEATA